MTVNYQKLARVFLLFQLSAISPADTTHFTGYNSQLATVNDKGNCTFLYLLLLYLQLLLTKGRTLVGVNTSNLIR